MAYAEWLMLTLAIYFHDLGMVVTKDEFEHRYETAFKEYKEKVLNEGTGGFFFISGIRTRKSCRTDSPTD